jgi:heptosyltransferase-2
MFKELIIMPDLIGNLALALSVVHRKITMQNANVTLLVPQKLVPLCSALADYPIIPYNAGSFLNNKKTLSQIREGGFDVVYILPHSLSAAWLAMSSGIRKRCGVVGELRDVFLTRPLPKSVDSKTRHLTYEYALVMETDFVPPEYWQGIDFVESKEYAGRIVFCPGAMHGPAKQWDGFKQLIEMLPGKQIVVLGDANDAEAGELLEAASPDRVVSLAGKTTIVEACRIIAGAKVVVANDSGLMHIAGYLGTPVIGIFGSTTPIWTRPLGSQSAIAYVKQECSPCFSRVCKFKHYKCFELLSAEYVSSLIHQLLHDKPGSY